MSKETDLLQQAANEIKSLRKQNELMAARLDVFDKCMLLLHTPPMFPPQLMSMDLAWKIDNHVKEMLSVEEAENDK